MITTRYIALGFIGLMFFSCKPKFDAPEESLGEVNPVRFVSIGTNFTAGYSDDALHYEGQLNTFTNILNTQFNLEGGDTYTYSQPILSESSVGINADGNSRLVLGYKTDCNNETSLSPVRYSASGDLGSLAANIPSGFNNIGIPGLSVLDVNKIGYGNPASGTGNYNPFYARIATDQANSSILSDAVAQNPTFYSIHLGDQDIMAYAASGGSTGAMTPAYGAAGVALSGSLDEIVTALNGTGAKGVIGNIPDVTQYPFFNTIPYNGLNLDAANATTLNQVFNPLGISFVVGDNPFTIDDPSEPFGVRKMLPGELVLLSIPLDSVKCYGMGSISPIPDRYVLTLEEIDSIRARTNEYNEVILNIAVTENLAHVNVNLLMNQLNSGTVYNGITMNFNFVTGGVFSLDGKNLNPIGQAKLANAFIESINEKYSATIPHADVTKYHGIIFP